MATVGSIWSIVNNMITHDESRVYLSIDETTSTMNYN